MDGFNYWAFIDFPPFLVLMAMLNDIFYVDLTVSLAVMVRMNFRVRAWEAGHNRPFDNSNINVARTT